MVEGKVFDNKIVQFIFISMKINLTLADSFFRGLSHKKMIVKKRGASAHLLGRGS